MVVYQNAVAAPTQPLPPPTPPPRESERHCCQITEIPHNAHILLQHRSDTRQPESNVMNPDPDPDPVGPASFRRIRIRIHLNHIFKLNYGFARKFQNVKNYDNYDADDKINNVHWHCCE